MEQQESPASESPDSDHHGDRRFRLVRTIAIGAVGGLAAWVIATLAGGVPRDLEVRSLTIVDNDGHPRIELAISEEDTAQIVLKDQSGRTTLFVFAEGIGGESGILIGSRMPAAAIDLRADGQSDGTTGDVSFWVDNSARLTLGTTESSSYIVATADQPSDSTTSKFDVSVRDDVGVLIYAGLGPAFDEGLLVKSPPQNPSEGIVKIKKGKQTIWETPAWPSRSDK